MAGRDLQKYIEEVNIIEKGTADAAASQMLSGLSAGIREMVAQEVTAHMDEVTQAILARMPSEIKMPEFEPEKYPERLMTVDEIAYMLGCSAATVKRKMNLGELVYVVSPGTKDRKMPYMWVRDYIYRHTKYTGPFHQRREVIEEYPASIAQ